MTEKIGGVIYAVTVEKAKELGWKIGLPQPGAGNDLFVEAHASYEAIHSFIALPDISSDFHNIPINGYDKTAMQVLLAYSILEVKDFTESFVQWGWYNRRQTLELLPMMPIISLNRRVGLRQTHAKIRTTEMHGDWPHSSVRFKST